MSKKELFKIVSEFTRGVLDNGKSTDKCFMVCSPLQSYLSYSGIETELIEGELTGRNIIYSHYWLQLKDGRIIDQATTYQFRPKDCKTLILLMLNVVAILFFGWIRFSAAHHLRTDNPVWLPKSLSDLNKIFNCLNFWIFKFQGDSIVFFSGS